MDLCDSIKRDQQLLGEQVEAVARGVAESAAAKSVAKLSDSVNARVESCMATLNLVDGMVRKEIEERSADSRQLWGAIENHTHDLDLSTLRTEDDPPRAGALAAAPRSSAMQEPTSLAPRAHSALHGLTVCRRPVNTW